MGWMPRMRSDPAHGRRGRWGIDEPKYLAKSLPNVAGPVRLPIGADFPCAPAAAKLGAHGTSEWYMVADFLRSIHEGGRPPIDVYDALMYSLPGLCARDSARAGRPVAIPQ